MQLALAVHSGLTSLVISRVYVLYTYLLMGLKILASWRTLQKAVSSIRSTFRAKSMRYNIRAAGSISVAGVCFEFVDYSRRKKRNQYEEEARRFVQIS